MALQIIERLYQHAAVMADRIALSDVRERRARDVTYGQLLASVEQLAGTLAEVTTPNAVVMVVLPNHAEFFVAYLGVLLSGRTVFPVHPGCTAQELQVAAERSRAGAMIAVEPSRQALATAGLQPIEAGIVERPPVRPPPMMVDASATACMLLESSGTTGQPKIAVRRGPSLDAVARNVAKAVALTTRDTVLGLVPACHSYGVENVVLGPLWAGSRVVLRREFDTHLVRAALIGGGVTVLPGVPTMFELLAQGNESGERSRTLRTAYSAGANLPLTVNDAFAATWGLRIGQLFGMTEIGSVTFNDASADDCDSLSVGVPMDGVRIRIVSPESRDLDASLPPGREGEVAVAAPSMLAGYIRQSDGVCVVPDAVRDGYFFTGDLGRLDEQGRLTITGRLKLMVDVGGQKVNLQEVERTLVSHAGVASCVVVPVSVSETIVRLKAVVELSPNAGAVSADALRAFLRPKLSAHKIPRTFEFRDSLPRSATGKVLRQAL